MYLVSLTRLLPLYNAQVLFDLQQKLYEINPNFVFCLGPTAACQ